jgi:cytochrome c553
MNNRLLLIALLSGFVGINGAARAAGDAAAGKTAALSCAMCHGANGEGTKMGPRVAGMDPARFTQAMNDYKSGKRDNAMMKNQASQPGANDIANLAAYYASLK